MATSENDRMPNGRPKTSIPKPPRRRDEPFFENIFPDTNIGKLLHGLSIQFLIKQEYRMGWAYRGACSEVDVLLDHPCETVAAHMWGVNTLLTTISKDEQFQKELPDFNIGLALQMATLHDVPELITSDITPEDKVDKHTKSKQEKDAMIKILSYHPEQVAKSLLAIYEDYETKKSIEAKFVKDCDKLDFMINAFVYERQGFDCIAEFYYNTLYNNEPMYTQIAKDMGKILCEVRNDLSKEGRLYSPK